MLEWVVAAVVVVVAGIFVWKKWFNKKDSAE